MDCRAYIKCSVPLSEICAFAINYHSHVFRVWLAWGWNAEYGCDHAM